MSISKILYQTLCVFSQIKDRNILNRIFILLPRSCPGVGLRGAGGVKNFSVGICDGAPLTALSSLILSFAHYLKPSRKCANLFVSSKPLQDTSCYIFLFLCYILEIPQK